MKDMNRAERKWFNLGISETTNKYKERERLKREVMKTVLSWLYLLLQK